MAKPFYVENEGFISFTLTIIGVVLFLVSLMAVLGADFLGLGGWDFWIGAIGAIILFVGGIWLIAHLLKLKEFKKLINVQGKKALMQNLDELEYTAWRLPEKYDKLVAEKKKEYKF
ncbi:MAG: hypothetical protein WCK39_06535 [Methanomassiliicoccales archaeon]